mmetsp:Transcript_17342/g.45445  ORF Transcript_17342/g.45445 Transcript_17342/m.45445 type:complete len:144 (+) Transcript_17342:149-580(+)
MDDSISNDLRRGFDASAVVRCLPHLLARGVPTLLPASPSLSLGVLPQLLISPSFPSRPLNTAVATTEDGLVEATEPTDARWCKAGKMAPVGEASSLHDAVLGLMSRDVQLRGRGDTSREFRAEHLEEPENDFLRVSLSSSSAE